MYRLIRTTSGIIESIVIRVIAILIGRDWRITSVSCPIAMENTFIISRFSGSWVHIMIMLFLPNQCIKFTDTKILQQNKNTTIKDSETM